MPLPHDLDISDWLCFQGMGAYTLAIRSYFNSMESVVRIEKLVTVDEEREAQEAAEKQLQQEANEKANDATDGTRKAADPKGDNNKNPAFGNFRYWIMKQITV